MAEIRVRNVEEWVVGWFRTQAKQHRTSLEGELRQALKELAQERKRRIVDELRVQLRDLEAKYGTLSDSTALIRSERDRRG